jgi:hypothetical protein
MATFRKTNWNKRSATIYVEGLTGEVKTKSISGSREVIPPLRPRKIPIAITLEKVTDIMFINSFSLIFEKP